MPICACGCGGSPKRGKFLPGHDQKLRKEIEEKVGGLLKLSALTEISEDFSLNKINCDDFCKKVKAFFLI